MQFLTDLFVYIPHKRPSRDEVRNYLNYGRKLTASVRTKPPTRKKRTSPAGLFPAETARARVRKGGPLGTSVSSRASQRRSWHRGPGLWDLGPWFLVQPPLPGSEFSQVVTTMQKTTQTNHVGKQRGAAGLERSNGFKEEDWQRLGGR